MVPTSQGPSLLTIRLLNELSITTRAADAIPFTLTFIVPHTWFVSITAKINFLPILLLCSIIFTTNPVFILKRFLHNAEIRNANSKYFCPAKAEYTNLSFRILKICLAELYLFHKHNRQRQFGKHSPEEHMNSPSAVTRRVRSLILMMSSPLRSALSTSSKYPRLTLPELDMSLWRGGESARCGRKADRSTAREVVCCYVRRPLNARWLTLGQRDAVRSLARHVSRRLCDLWRYIFKLPSQSVW